MRLREFIEKFTHNNLIRLVYKEKGEHSIVSDSWDDVSMDWEVNKQQGIFRHYINNEVLGLVSICGDFKHGEAINIVIEKLENQTFLPEIENNQVNICAEQ